MYWSVARHAGGVTAAINLVYYAFNTQPPLSVRPTPITFMTALVSKSVGYAVLWPVIPVVIMADSRPYMVVGDTITQYGTIRYYHPITVPLKNCLRAIWNWER